MSTEPPQTWSHSPVAFVLSAFRGSSSRWCTTKKECYAVVSRVIRLAHTLASCSEFSIFTDHKNILFMLSPTRFKANVARHVVHKTQRWALRLAEFNFTVNHIPGESNVWADMLSRWASGVPPISSIISSFLVPFITEELPELPPTHVIIEAQEKNPPVGDEYSQVALANGLKAWKN